MASPSLNYAEDLRMKSKAGLSQNLLEPEEPHQTTDVLSANALYHSSVTITEKNHAAGCLPFPAASHRPSNAMPNNDLATSAVLPEIVPVER